MIAACYEHGYAQTTVADVVALAGVSRSAFYEHFADRQACFLATVETIVDEGSSDVTRAYREPGTWEARLRRAFEAFVDIVARQPGPAYVAIVELLALGAPGAPHRDAAAARFERMVRQSFDQDAEGRAVPDSVVAAIVAGLRSVAYARLRRGEPEQMHALVEPLLAWALRYVAAGPPPGRDADEAGAAAAQHTAAGARRAATGAAQPDARPGAERRPLRTPHREWIVRTVAALCRDDGFAVLSVPRISAAASISNQTFYAHFSSKQDAFVAAIEYFGNETLERVTRASRAPGSAPAALSAGLDELLVCVAREDDLARLLFAHAATGGARALDYNAALLDRFAGLLHANAEDQGAQPSARHPVAAEATAGSIWHAIQVWLAAHSDSSTIWSLRPLLYHLAQPLPPRHVLIGDGLL